MSRTKAINEKCKDCIYDPLAGGTWREQVEMCRSEKSCSLWPYRPITMATLNANRKGGAADVSLNLDALDALVDGLEDEDDEVPAAA